MKTLDEIKELNKFSDNAKRVILTAFEQPRSENSIEVNM